MFRALLRLQLRSLLAAFTRGGRKGKKPSKLGLFGYGALMLYVVVVFFGLFYLMADTLCAPLLAAGLGWLYFALEGILALALGVVGSVFMTQSQLFEARDNELLLSMPIPPAAILGSRMLALYLQSFLLSALVLTPAFLAYGAAAPVTAAHAAAWAAVYVLLPLAILALSAVLGWLVALLSSRMRNKSLLTVVLYLVFLGGYLYLYSRMSHYLNLLIANGPAVADVVQRRLYPFWQLGLACLGGGAALARFAACAAVPFALVYWVLARTFLRLATTRRGAARIRYRERAVRPRTPDGALLLREARHLWGSPLYLLNGAFGSVCLLIGAGFLAFRGRTVAEFAAMIQPLRPWLGLLGCGLVCLLVGMNLVTAPSVSLEGRSLWLLQSLPVSGWQALRAKLRLHLLVTMPPALVCAAAAAAVLRTGPLGTAALLVTPLAFTDVCAVLGLALNLRMPRLDWDSEAQAVKRSGSAMIAVFADWGIVLALGLLFYATRRVWSPDAFALAAAVPLVLVSALVRRWLRRGGAARFQTLS